MIHVRLTVTCVAAAVVAVLVANCGKKSTPTTPSTPTVTLPNSGNPPNSTLNMDARTSMRTPANIGTIVFDDFQLTATTTINRVTWQGIYCAEVLNRAAPAPTATGFLVGFYADAGNNPDRNNPLQATTYPIGSTAETKDFETVANCVATSTGWSLFNYAVTLATPFTAQANTRYWLGIQAQVNYLQAGNPDFIYWAWRNGIAVNNRSVSIVPDGTATVYAADRAFSLQQ